MLLQLMLSTCVTVSYNYSIFMQLFVACVLIYMESVKCVAIKLGFKCEQMFEMVQKNAHT